MEARKLWRTMLVAAIVSLGTGFAPGCGSDGGTDMNPCVELQGAATPASLTVVAEDGGSECDVLRVNLIVTDVADVLAANMVVTFPQGLVSFNNASEVGSILTDGSAVSVQHSVPNPGQLVVGITRLSNTGKDVVGGAQLLRLTFVRVATQGSGAFAVSGALLDSSTPPQPIPGVQFEDATVGIVQR